MKWMRSEEKERKKRIATFDQHSSAASPNKSNVLLSYTSSSDASVTVNNTCSSSNEYRQLSSRTLFAQAVSTLIQSSSHPLPPLPLPLHRLLSHPSKRPLPHSIRSHSHSHPFLHRPHLRYSQSRSYSCTSPP